MCEIIALCRVCLENVNEYVSLNNPIDEEREILYREGFNSTTRLNSKDDDELPQNLCWDCAENLKSAFDFIQSAIRADKILQQKINRKEESENIFSEQFEGTFVDENEDENSKEEIVIFEIEENFNEDIIKEEEIIECDESYENIQKCITPPNNKTNSKSNNNENFQTVQKEDNLSGKRRKLLLCSICGKTCSQKSSLESHMLKHKGERPHKCKFCEKSYYTRNGLKLHMNAHTEKGQEKKFICEICSKAFATSQRLCIHNLVHTGQKDFECPLCSKKFATEFRLRSHSRTHTGERPYECKVCGIKFAQNNALNCHMRIHTGEKPYECKICGKRFNQNTILKTHMTLHTGKTVQCPNCDKKFSRPSYLILHQREHTGEKPYACHKCPNRYKQKSHLDRHLDTHFGIKHICQKCGKEYSKKSSLTIHMYTHVEEKPFYCESCLISFIRRDKFRKHLRKVHGKDLIKNEIIDAEIVKKDSESVEQNSS